MTLTSCFEWGFRKRWCLCDLEQCLPSGKGEKKHLEHRKGLSNWSTNMRAKWSLLRNGASMENPYRKYPEAMLTDKVNSTSPQRPGGPERPYRESCEPLIPAEFLKEGSNLMRIVFRKITLVPMWRMAEGIKTDVRMARWKAVLIQKTRW